MNELVAEQVENFQQALAALENECIARKQALFAKLAELLGVPTAPVKGKPGRKPKGFGAAVLPAFGPRPGRMPKGEPTLPDLIVKVLQGAEAPMNAIEILAGLQKVGWQTMSGDPQAMVYKTLHRIKKDGCGDQGRARQVRRAEVEARTTGAFLETEERRRTMMSPAEPWVLQTKLGREVTLDSKEQVA
jgi:hypothetical protein